MVLHSSGKQPLATSFLQKALIPLSWEYWAHWPHPVLVPQLHSASQHLSDGSSSGGGTEPLCRCRTRVSWSYFSSDAMGQPLLSSPGKRDFCQVRFPPSSTELSPTQTTVAASSPCDGLNDSCPPQTASNKQKLPTELSLSGEEVGEKNPAKLIQIKFAMPATNANYQLFFSI